MVKKKACRIFIIDDDELFADCLANTVKKCLSKESKGRNVKVEQFKEAVSAVGSLLEPLPDLIFLDVLLPGADGFTFLNEIASYVDTAKIPVILVTSLELPETDLSIYGVRGILNKETMTPREVEEYVERYTN